MSSLSWSRINREKGGTVVRYYAICYDLETDMEHDFELDATNLSAAKKEAAEKYLGIVRVIWRKTNVPLR